MWSWKFSLPSPVFFWFFSLYSVCLQMCHCKKLSWAAQPLALPTWELRALERKQCLRGAGLHGVYLFRPNFLTIENIIYIQDSTRKDMVTRLWDLPEIGRLCVKSKEGERRIIIDINLKRFFNKWDDFQ